MSVPVKSFHGYKYVIRSRDHRLRDKMPCRRTGLTRRQLPRWERPRSLVFTLCIGEDLFNSHTTVQLNFLYRDTHRSLSYDCPTMHSFLSLNVPFLWYKHLLSRISNCHTAALLLPLIKRKGRSACARGQRSHLLWSKGRVQVRRRVRAASSISRFRHRRAWQSGHPRG